MPHGIQGGHVDYCVRDCAHRRFGVESHADSGGSKHVQVVGAVAHGDGVFQGDALGGSPLAEVLLLRRTVDHRAQHFARQRAVDNFQLIGDPVIHPEVLRDGPQDLVETARNHCHGVTCRFERRHEFRCALTEFHLGPYGIDDVGRQSGEDRHPGMQALGEVELAAHGRFGDRSDLLLLPGVGSQQLDDLLLDQRGINIHDQELAGRLPEGGGDNGRVHPGEAGGRRSMAQCGDLGSGAGFHGQIHRVHLEALVAAAGFCGEGSACSGQQGTEVFQFGRGQFDAVADRSHVRTHGCNLSQRTRGTRIRFVPPCCRLRACCISYQSRRVLS